MPNRLAVLGMRQWLGLSEATEFLRAGEVRVSNAELLRFALDEAIPVWVFLPHPVPATPVEPGDDRPVRVRQIEGLCKLQMVGVGRREVEVAWAQKCGRPYVEPDGKAGALVERDGGVFQLPAFGGREGTYSLRRSALPQGSLLAFRPDELRSLAERLRDATEPKPQRKESLGVRERRTLLVIIAALAEMAKVPVEKPSKAGGIIEEATQRLGARVASRTIEEHLRAIPEALERMQGEG